MLPKNGHRIERRAPATTPATSTESVNSVRSFREVRLAAQNPISTPARKPHAKLTDEQLTQVEAWASWGERIH
jgi:hypothetical protein